MAKNVAKMNQNSKYATKGAKKLFSLTKTKIRLARESKTVYVKPKPLPLVKFFSGAEINTIDEAEEFRQTLKDKIDYDNPESIAKTIFQLMDIIEGVKHKYEPKEYFCLLKEEEIKKILRENKKINLLLAHPPVEGLNLFIGEDPPDNTIHYGRVTTNLAVLINIALPKEIKKMNIHIGRKTLINNAVHYALEAIKNT